MQVPATLSHRSLQQPSQKLHLQALVLPPHRVRTHLVRVQRLGVVAPPLHNPQRRGNKMTTQPARLRKPVLMLPQCKPAHICW